MKRAAYAIAIGAIAVSGIVGCQARETPAPEVRGAEVFELPISQNQVMVSLIDFAADGMWRPADPDRTLTDSDWDMARNDALSLAAATSLMTVPSAGGERDLKFISDSNWRNWTMELRAAALDGAKAAEAKDKSALRAAGDRAVEVCQSCHTHFKPGMPGGGVTRYPQYPKPPRP